MNINLKTLTSSGIRFLFERYMLKLSPKTQLVYALPIYHTVETIKHTIVILKLPLQSVQFFCRFCQLKKYIYTLNCWIDFGTKCSDAVFGKGLFYRWCFFGLMDFFLHFLPSYPAILYLFSYFTIKQKAWKRTSL